MKYLIKIIIIIFLIIFLYSGLQIIKWNMDNKKENEQIKNINKKTIIQKDDNNRIEIIENNTKKSDPYWDYIKMDLMNVNFEELLNINPDTKGWIKIEGTNINYPFVQTIDNHYYLYHTFDRSYNGGGWVFLDYRNNINNEEKNTIIYAHGRENKTMFGTLKNVLTLDWINNTNNHIVKMSTKYENTLWQVFSIYIISTSTDYLQTDFKDGEFSPFIQKLLERSNHNFNTNVDENDKILTLSTCYNNQEKIVLHAKLIKKSKKQI